MLQQVPQKTYRHGFRAAVRVKTRGKSSRRSAVMQAGGKPYGLKDQIYRQSRAGSPEIKAGRQPQPTPASVGGWVDRGRR